jgi:hypothetical protein
LNVKRASDLHDRAKERGIIKESRLIAADKGADI